MQKFFLFQDLAVDIVYLKALNLESRFEKVDATIMGILTGVQTLQGRLDLVERNISDQNKIIQSAINQSKENLLDKIQTSNKKNNQLNYITIVLGAIIIVFLLLNKYKII